MAFISAIKAQTLIDNECRSFVTMISKAKPSKKRVKDQEVVRDFPDVFPKELLGLPLRER